MQDRFTLRFQDGEREGDTVRITSPRFTLGRRPGNTIQVQDPSISGQHAEFVTDDEGVLLRDLGSTNGTRVGGTKIVEARPGHGDILTFGSINAVFEDSTANEMPVTGRARKTGNVDPRPGADPSAEEGVARVSAESIARSGKGSKASAIVAVFLLIGGGVAAAFFFKGGGATDGKAQLPVVIVPGNKLEGSSFEGDGAPANWSSSEQAPASFGQWENARSSGQEGMSADLQGGEWALLVSDPVSVSPGRQVEFAAKLRARGDASGRIGIEFLGAKSADGEKPGFKAWGPWIADVSTHQDIAFTSPVPPGMGRARVLVEARAAQGGEEVSGSVDVDDVSLVANTDSAKPVAKVGEYELWGLGQALTSLHLTKISNRLMGDLHGVGGDGRRDYPMAVTATAVGFQIDLGAAQQMLLRVESTALDGGLATLGNGKLVERGNEWDASEVDALLFGTGHGLVAFEFETPVEISGRAEGEAVRIRVHHKGKPVLLLVNFQAQRARAGDLAFKARNAEAAGRLGDCLEKWNEILAQSPYDADLVEEARSTRARLGNAGRVELKRVEKIFEEAHFFRLLDLYRQCRAEAVAVGEKYRGSDVEGESKALVATIQEALGSLEEDLSADEIKHLNSIIKVLDMTESPQLASAVRSYLAEEFGKEN